MSTFDMMSCSSSCELGISGASLLGAGVIALGVNFLTAADLKLLFSELIEGWVPLL
jgi:hypothetical protein